MPTPAEQANEYLDSFRQSTETISAFINGAEDTRVPIENPDTPDIPTLQGVVKEIKEQVEESLLPIAEVPKGLVVGTETTLPARTPGTAISFVNGDIVEGVTLAGSIAITDNGWNFSDNSVATIANIDGIVESADIGVLITTTWPAIDDACILTTSATTGVPTGLTVLRTSPTTVLVKFGPDATSASILQITNPHLVENETVRIGISINASEVKVGVWASGEYVTETTSVAPTLTAQSGTVHLGNTGDRLNAAPMTLTDLQIQLVNLNETDLLNYIIYGTYPSIDTGVVVRLFGNEDAVSGLPNMEGSIRMGKFLIAERDDELVVIQTVKGALVLKGALLLAR